MAMTIPYIGWGGAMQYVGGASPGWRTNVMDWRLTYQERIHDALILGRMEGQGVRGVSLWKASIDVLVPVGVTEGDIQITGAFVALELCLDAGCSKKFEGNGSIQSFDVNSPLDGPVTMRVLVDSRGGTGAGHSLKMGATQLVEFG